MAKAISFNGQSLQTDNIHIRSIDHDSMDGRELNIQRLGVREGGIYIDDNFAPKTIRVTGTIIGSSASDLDQRIDDLKQLLYSPEKNLDVEYISGTRRYKCTSAKISIPRDHYNITFAPFDIEFVCSSSPFGTSLDTATIDYSPVNFTIGTFISNATFDGTYKPMPIIVLTVNDETALEEMTFTNTTTGEYITVTYSYTAGDVLQIDTSDYTVTINGVATDYLGSFPEFVQGGNDFKVSFIGENWNVTLKLIYYARFL